MRNENNEYTKVRGWAAIIPIDSFGIIAILALFALLGTGIISAVGWVCQNFFVIIAAIAVLGLFLGAVRAAISHCACVKIVRKAETGKRQEKIVAALKQNTVKYLLKNLVICGGVGILLILVGLLINEVL